MNENLQLLQEDYRFLFEHSSDAILFTIPDGTILAANPAACRMFQQSEQEICAVGREGLIDAGDARLAPALEQRANTGTFRGELNFIRKDGTIFPAEITSSVFRDEQGNPRACIILRDVTERKRAEEQLRKLSHVIEQSPLSVVVTDLNANIEYVNSAFSEISGYTRDQVIGKNPRILQSGETSSETYKEMWDTLSRGETWRGEFLNKRKNGELYWEFAIIAPVVNANGQVESYVGIKQDITERKRAEQQLRYYALLIENANDAIIAADAKFRLTIWNKGAEKLYGWTADEALGRHGLELLQTVFPEGEKESVLVEIRGRGSYRNEVTQLRRDGTRIAVEVAAMVLYDVRGQVNGYASVNRDISERKREEQELRESEERYRDLFENNPNPMWIYDTDTLAILAVNERAIQHYGYSHQEFLSMTLADLRPVEDVPRLEEYFRDHPESARRSSAWRHRKKNGELIDVEINSHVLPERLGPNLRLVLVNDVTARNRAEAELRQRLAELEAIHTISTALRAAQSPEEMLPILLDETLAALETTVGAIWLYHGERDELTAVVMRGWFEKYHALGIKPGEGITGRIFAGGEMRIIPDFAADDWLPPAVRGTIPSGWGGVAVPLKNASDNVGVMFVAVALPRAITMEQVNLLSSLSEMAGTALHRLRLHAEMQRRVERLQTLQRVDRAITTSFDSRITLVVLLEQTRAQLDVDAAGVLLYNPTFLFLEFGAGQGFQTRAYERSSIHVGDGLAGRAALERRTLFIANVTEEPNPVRPELWASEGFVSYAVVPLLVKGELKGELEVFSRKQLAPDAEWFDFLETLAHQAAIAIDNAQLFAGLQRTNLELALAYDETIEGWSRALDMRDQETEGHSRRVTEMTLGLARRLGLAEKDLVHLRRGALLHDIGKMGVPDSILHKPGALTAEEWRIMQTHPQLAFDLLYPITFLRPALDIPFAHHEKWDGTGYPRGLRGAEIPIAARIFAIVDVWDALNSDRPYRPRWGKDTIREHVRAQAGQHFDPQVVEPFLEMVSD